MAKDAKLTVSGNGFHKVTSSSSLFKLTCSS